MTSIIIRMRELAVQAVNDTNNIQDRQNLQLEVTALKEEIDRIAAVTTWAGKKLMHGSNDAGGTTPKTFTFQVGASQNPQDVITVDIKAMTSERLGLVDTLAFPTIDNLSQTGAVPKAEVSALTVTLAASGTTTVSGAYDTANNANTPRDDTNDYLITIATPKDGDTIRVKIPVPDGSTTGDNDAFSKTVTVLLDATSGASVAAASTALADAIRAAGITGYTAEVDSGKVRIVKSATPSLTIANGNSVTTNNVVTSKNSTITVDTFDQGETLKFNVEGREVSVTNAAASGYTQDVKGTAAAIAAAINAKEIAGVTATVVDNVVTVTKANFNITTVAGSQTAMRLADAALELVNTQRATLGAVSNRLEKTVSNMTNVVTNLQAGRGRIEDADFAAESTELAKTQILQQASMAMLSQANASKQSVMSLLQGR